MVNRNAHTNIPDWWVERGCFDLRYPPENARDTPVSGKLPIGPLSSMIVMDKPEFFDYCKWNFALFIILKYSYKLALYILESRGNTIVSRCSQATIQWCTIAERRAYDV